MGEVYILALYTTRGKYSYQSIIAAYGSMEKAQQILNRLKSTMPLPKTKQFGIFVLPINEKVVPQTVSRRISI